MWIRSQDKEMLLKVSEIEITVMANGDVIVYGGNEGGEFSIAKYSSKERAIEELDRIYETFREPPGTDNFIYQMREEDEE